MDQRIAQGTFHDWKGGNELEAGASAKEWGRRRRRELGPRMTEEDVQTPFKNLGLWVSWLTECAVKPLLWSSSLLFGVRSLKVSCATTHRTE